MVVILIMENEIGNLVRLFIWRTTKKNHDTMMTLDKPAKDMFGKVGVRQEIYQLSNSKDPETEGMGFTNISKTVSAREDEEVWLELQFYKDSKHHDEVAEKMKSDKSAMELGKKFMEIITPGSCVEGKFNQFGS
jgi:uncharacterized protein YbaA (DUF1428 family)